MRRWFNPEPSAAMVVDALGEAAALCAIDGLVEHANAAWRAVVGDGPRLPPGLQGPLRAALDLGAGEGPWPSDPRALRVAAARVGPDRLLVRLKPVPAPAADPADLAAQTEARQELTQRHKMEAIGQLAGGVAHDFNNLLSAIGMRVDELLLRHPLGDPAYEPLGEAREDINRAAALVHQLLTFSRKATIRRETLDLAATLADFEILLRRLLRGALRLETAYGRDTPLVRIDKAQLEAAVMNLVVNARDAMRDRGGGVIRLRTVRIEPGEAGALGHPAPPETAMAMIEVSDEGPGIPADLIDNVFEPFFTTKGAGEGTGLGLATVYGVARQAEGWVVAVSPPGQGAAFRIFLPADVPRLVIDERPVAGARRPPRDLSGAGRILFVEDEPRVRDVAARLLRGRGYEVIEAGDGEEALELAEQHAGTIDLLISDVSMPGMTGPELLKAARGFLGDAPVLFISGYAESEFSDLLEGETGVSFLAKPLKLQTLAEQVKARLGGT